MLRRSALRHPSSADFSAERHVHSFVRSFARSEDILICSGVLTMLKMKGIVSEGDSFPFWSLFSVSLIRVENILIWRENCRAFGEVSGRDGIWSVFLEEQTVIITMPVALLSLRFGRLLSLGCVLMLLKSNKGSEDQKIAKSKPHKNVV